MPFLIRAYRQKNRDLSDTIWLRTISIRNLILGAIYSIYIAGVTIIVHKAWFVLPGDHQTRFLEFITLFLLSFTAVIISILAIVLFPTFKQALAFYSLILALSVITSSIPIGVPNPLSLVSIHHWGFKGLAIINRLGSDIGRDDCWKFPSYLRNAMEQADKNYYECDCLGEKLFDPQNCNTPGIARFFKTEIGLPPPSEPDSPGAPPAMPTYPVPPACPEILNNKAESLRCAKSLQTYHEQIERTNEDYQLQILAYQLRLDLYRSQVDAYTKKLEEWHNERNIAISNAEQEIENFINKMSWAFINVKDDHSYWNHLFQSWYFMLIIMAIWITVLFVAIKKA
jgi:hypothetical protein